MAGYSFGPHIIVNLIQYLAVIVFPWLLGAPTNPVSYVWLALAFALFLVITIRTRSQVLMFLGIASLLGVLPVLGFGLEWFAPRYLYFSGIVSAILLASLFELGWRSFGKLRLYRILAASVLGSILIANGALISNAAADLTEVTRQVRVPFRDIAREHPVFDQDTYVYFLNYRNADIFEMSVMFLLHYGKNVTVEGWDFHKIPPLREHSQAYLYYFSETGRPSEVSVEKSLNLHSSLSMPLQFQAPIRLEGFDVAKSNVRHGEMLPLLLYWRATGPIDRDYTVFVHLADENGKMVAGTDSQPRSGRLPTSSWQVNQLVVDAVLVPIADDIPSGNRYGIEVGLYYLPTLERVEILDGAGHPLGTSVTIEPFNMIK